jgi:hypothetical protein
MGYRRSSVANPFAGRIANRRAAEEVSSATGQFPLEQLIQFPTDLKYRRLTFRAGLAPKQGSTPLASNIVDITWQAKETYATVYTEPR